MKYVSVETYIYIHILTVSCCYVGTRYSDIQNRNLKIQYRSHCGNTPYIWWLYLYKSERLNYVTKINITFKNSWQLVNIVFRNIQMILTWHFWKKSFYLYFSLHYIMRQYHRLVIAFSTWIYRDKTYSYKSCTWSNEILSRSVYTPPDRSSIKRCINCHLSQVLVWIRFTSNSNLTLCCATFVIFITINAETNEHHDKRTSNWSSCKFS